LRRAEPRATAVSYHQTYVSSRRFGIVIGFVHEWQRRASGSTRTIDAPGFNTSMAALSQSMHRTRIENDVRVTCAIA
jgi:hypothetical protein